MPNDAELIIRGMAIAADELFAAGLNESANLILVAIKRRQEAARRSCPAGVR